MIKIVNGQLIAGGRAPICTTMVDTVGIHDFSANRRTLITWDQLKLIKMTGGDIRFIRTVGPGTFIPRSAWKDRADAKRFYDIAQSAFMYSKAGPPPPLPQHRFEGFVEAER